MKNASVRQRKGALSKATNATTLLLCSVVLLLAASDAAPPAPACRLILSSLVIIMRYFHVCHKQEKLEKGAQYRHPTYTT